LPKYRAIVAKSPEVVEAQLQSSPCGYGYEIRSRGLTIREKYGNADIGGDIAGVENARHLVRREIGIVGI
jgi:hypothetical protein